jgi:hypothetical protein
LEVGALDLESIGAPLPLYPGTSAGGRSLRGVIVSDSVRVSLTFGRVAKALDLRVIFLDHRSKGSESPTPTHYQQQ